MAARQTFHTVCLIEYRCILSFRHSIITSHSDILIVGQSRKKILQLIMEYLLSAEDIKGLNLQDVAHHRAASRPAIAGGGILGVVISDIELANI